MVLCGWRQKPADPRGWICDPKNVIFAEMQCPSPGPAHILLIGVLALGLTSAFLIRDGTDSHAQGRGAASPAGLSAIQAIHFNQGVWTILRFFHVCPFIWYTCR